MLDLSPRDLLLDHANRIPKPALLPDTVPRDVLARVHYYHVKDQLLRADRNPFTLPPPYIRIYQELPHKEGKNLPGH